MPPALPPPLCPAVPKGSSRPPRRRWSRWLLAGLALLLGLGLAIMLLLDPWLRRQLEQQVSQQTHGQYQLRVGALRTSLWQRSIRLQNLRLRPAATVADTLPRLRLDAARLHVTGVGLWALLLRRQVPIDSVVLDSAQLEVLALARQPTKNAGRPLHQQLPLHLPGVAINYLGLLHAQARYRAAGPATGAFKEASLTARQLLISPAGAADTQRLAYAAAWTLAVRQAQATGAGHRLTLGRLRFATATRRLVLDSLGIAAPGPGQGQPGALRISLALPRAVLTGLDAAKWQHRGQLAADSLRLERPQLAFTPPAQPPPDLWKLLAPVTRRATLAHLHLRRGHLRVQGLAHAPSVETIDATGTGILIDSAAQQEPRRIAYATAWTAHLRGLAAAFDAPNYWARSAHLRLNTAARTLRLSGLALVPRFSPAQLNRRQGYQTPQFAITVAELRVAGLDFARLVRHGDVDATRVTVRRPTVRIASDGRGPINPHRSIITPEEVRNIGIRINLHRLDLVGGNLYTRYRSPLSPVVGTLSINRFAGSLYNVSNDPRYQTTARPLTGTATAYLQNSCRMTVHLRVPLLDPQGRHRVWGSFGAGNFTMLNSMTVPTRLIEFKQGQVQGIDFDLTADQQQSRGTMTTRYTGLQLNLLSYKEGEIKQSLGKRVVSKLANALVIRDQNPRKSGRVVTGDMTSRREPRFSVFVLWRQGVVSGLLNNIGLPEALARKISQSQDEAPLPPAGR